jgi:hypothetical protein
MCHSSSWEGNPADGSPRRSGSEKISWQAEFQADRMTFVIGLNPTLHVLEVRAEGEMNSNNAQQIARRISEFASKHDCCRVLFDYVQTHITDSILSIYETPPCMEKEGLTQAMRLAVCYERDEQKHRFWETVFRNRGYMARVFEKEDDALQWLMDAERY